MLHKKTILYLISICQSTAGRCEKAVGMDRIIQHIGRDGLNFEEGQFVFWIGCSIIDALMRLKRWSTEATSQGDGLLVVSLDIPTLRIRQSKLLKYDTKVNFKIMNKSKCIYVKCLIKRNLIVFEKC